MHNSLEAIHCCIVQRGQSTVVLDVGIGAFGALSNTALGGRGEEGGEGRGIHSYTDE